MSIEEFQNKVDGAINDYLNEESDGKEFRNAIMDILIEVANPHLEEKLEATQP